MSSTGAERQRRYRAHKRGDHSLCDAGRCDPAAVTVTRDAGNAVTGNAPPGLAARGRRLWRELTESGKPAPAAAVLIEEACRIADRLDRLDRLLRGDEDSWLRFRVSDDGADVTVVIDKALSEARQQAAVLKQIVAELRQHEDESKPASGGSILDQLAARRAARLANAAG